jgi:dephospho-CoA kinase
MAAAQSPLDPEAAALCQRLAGLASPWEITRALELALLKTFCVPSISGLLQRSGELEQRPRKRYDDTGLMVAELLRHGPESAAGAAVIARLNRIHAGYAIANDDCLHVLSTFVAEPIRWLERYGWRPLNEPERQALFRFWLRVGARMGLHGLPGNLEAMLAGLLRGLLEPQVARSRLANLSQRLRPQGSARFYSQRPSPSYGARFRLGRPRWAGVQRRIGLTGGIASGKSSVGALLEARGLPVLDADHYAREALAPETPATQAVLARYGEAVQGGAAGRLDRAALGRIVFADAAERRWLEALVHPLVRQRFDQGLAAQAQAPAVVLMIPLLFEAGLEGLCSEVWLVDCDEAQQLQRLMARDGLSEAEARARLAAQWPLARKRGLADVRLDNRGPREALAAQLAQRLGPA